MFSINVSEKGGATKRYDFDKSEVTIGRIQGNDVILPKGNVSKRHARIVLKDGRFVAVDLKSTNGTYVNGRRITSPLVIKEGHKIYIGDFVLTVQRASAEVAAGAASEPPAPPSRSEPVAPPSKPSEPPSGASIPSPAPAAAAPAGGRHFLGGGPTAAGVDPTRLPLPEPEPPLESSPPPLPKEASSPGSEPSAASASAFRLDEEPFARNEPSVAPPVPEERQPSAASLPPVPPQSPSSPPSGSLAAPVYSESAGSGVHSVKEALVSLMPQLSTRFDVTDTSPAALHDADRRARAQNEIEAIIEGWHQGGAIGADIDQAALADLALAEAVGFGALESLLADDSVREVVIDGPNRVEVDRGKGLKPSGLIFSSMHALHVVALRLVAQSGSAVMPGVATYEVTLPYGPRVAVVLPPIAARGPIVEVRRIADARSLETLVAQSALSQAMADTIADAIESRKNIAVIGAVGHGVTTLLGAMASLCSKDDRIVTLEDGADLAIDHPRTVTLSSGAGLTGTAFSDVLRQGSRLRCDRMVIDDLRPDDVYLALTEVSARPRGNLLGIHGNQGEPIALLKAFVRLGASKEAGVELVGSAIDMVIEVAQGADRRHRVVRIMEVSKTKSGQPKGVDIFTFGDDGFTGKNGASSAETSSATLSSSSESRH